MLEVKNAVKTFDGFRALDGLTMTVPKGAVYGLVGPNGAGKSTIIRHLAGIYRQDSGEVLLDSQPVYENTEAKRRMAVIGDDWYYFPQAGIKEMAKFYAGIYPAFSWERYEKLKQVFPLDEKMMLRRMSKGMQKQAAFWLTVCCMPEYLILDEPVDGLDPVMRRQVWSLLLGDVAERGFPKHRLLTDISETVVMFTVSTSITFLKQHQRQPLPILLRMTVPQQKSIFSRWIRKPV